MLLAIIFIVLSVICWGSIVVILCMRPVYSYKRRMRIIWFLYAVVLANIVIAALSGGILGMCTDSSLVAAVSSGMPVLFAVLMMKKYFAAYMEDNFFPFRVTRIAEGRIWGKLRVDEYHFVVDAELVDFPEEGTAISDEELNKRYSSGALLWVDVKNSNVDLPFVSVRLH